VAQGLLNRKSQEEVEVQVDNAKKHYRIDSIAPILHLARSSGNVAKEEQ